MALRSSSLILFLLVAQFAFGQERLASCFVEFHGYNPAGMRIEPIEVALMRRLGSDYPEPGKTLDDDLSSRGAKARGARMYFPPALLNSGAIQAQVWLPQSGEFRLKHIVLTMCRQRESVLFGRTEDQIGEVVPWYPAFGRLTGCDFDGDWWIRTESLFDTDAPYETTVDPATGNFEIIYHVWARHLILVGKGSRPVRFFVRDGFDPGQKALDLGSFDIGDSCPMEVNR